MQKKISLLGTGRGERLAEINRLLISISGTAEFVELIFVDQSEEDNISELFTKFADKVNFKLIKSEPCSLSKARNIGLQQATGNILGFCDDDAFYTSDSLKYLSALPAENIILSVPVKDFSSNENYARRNFPKIKKSLGYLGVIKYSLSVGTFIFVGNRLGLNDLKFDERLGAGTALGGSEETELFFRLLSKKYNAFFDPFMCVYHDNDNFDGDFEFIVKKYEKYAIGYAVVIKKYILHSRFVLILEVFRVIFRCFAGMLLPSRRVLCGARLRGFCYGLTFQKYKIL